MPPERSSWVLVADGERCGIEHDPILLRGEERDSMGGYAGKYLEIDLAKGAISEFHVPAEEQRKFLGGS